MEQEYFTHTLHNGMRVIHIPNKSAVAYCGLAINAGSRDEEAGKFGLAHFVEHTLFKGTKHRRAWHILNRMERVGGELNAYTTKEGTMLYSIFPHEHFERASELIADLVSNSIFPDAELAKEREVVMDEVDSYRDSPSEAIYDDFEDMIWRGSPLGHNILGTEADLNSMTGSDCREYIDNLYVPENMIFFMLGNVKSEKVFHVAERYFGQLNHSLVRPMRLAPSIVTPFKEKVNIGSHQSHTIYGAPVFSMHDSRKYAMSLLNNMLGGPGMNSLLNVAIRERRGYAYTVESSLSLMSDCGLMQIYFGSDAEHVKPSLRLINNIIDNLANKALNERTLDAAKKQYIGQLLVASDSNESQALSAAKSYLFYNRISSIATVAERIKAITPTDMAEAASLITSQYASILTME